MPSPKLNAAALWIGSLVANSIIWLGLAIILIWSFVRHEKLLIGMGCVLVAGTCIALREQKVPFGVTMEKYYMPSYLSLAMIDVPCGEHHVPEDPSDKVYSIKVDVRPVAEQWIVKVGYTNNVGKPTAIFLRVTKATWLNNHPGELFSGQVLPEPVRGL